MANNTIKGFKINNVPHYLDAMFLSGATKEELLANVTGGTSSNPSLDALFIKPKSSGEGNNLELNSGVVGADKLNLVGAGAIQIKTGVDNDLKGENLELDCEAHTLDEDEMNEYGVKVCNGSMPKQTRVVALKLNAAEIVLDTQKANTVNGKFDPEELQVKFRRNKWNKGVAIEGDQGPIYAKMKARAFDFRCHDHGGIALQIAGKDSGANENKIKFESDRTSVPGATPVYCGEGGKGLEFGTFNNEHTSLYTGDYRFKGDATVYGVTRNTPTVNSSGKIDYPTQGDDFKDVINPSTHSATWNEILDAANKCKDLDQTIANKVAEAALDGSGIDVSGFVTRDTVEEVVASAITDMHIDTSAVESNLKQWVLDKHYVDALPGTLEFLKTGDDKGNLKLDVTGKFTWEQTAPKSATTVDEYGTWRASGSRVVIHVNEGFYTDPTKVYYKAGQDTTLADEVTSVPKGTIVYRSGYTIDFTGVPSVEDGGYDYYLMGDGQESYYENPANTYYKCKAKSGGKYFDGTDAAKDAIVPFEGLTQEEIAYYDSMGEILDEDGVTVLRAAIWARTDVWKKCTLWSVNELNINLETDSKIKLAGKKIETVWTHEVNESKVDTKMAEISLSTESLVGDITTVEFEKKISKNGDRSGQDTEIVYTYGNNVSDTTKVADFAAFKKNYNSKHTPKSDEELQAMYDEFVAEGQSFEIRVKVSELLGLVARVEALEARLAELEGEKEEAGNDGEPDIVPPTE